MSRWRFLKAVTVGWALALMGCVGDTLDTPSGLVRVVMQDGPAPDFTALHVTIERVEIHASNNPGDRGWITLGSPGRTVNILALRGGVVDELVKGAALSAGRYQQLRLLLGGTATITLRDGTSAPLAIPSALRTGIKIPLSFEVVAGTTKDIFLDFDGARSIQVITAGPNSTYMLRPVIRAVDKVVTGGVSGILSGPSGPLAGATVLAQGLDATGRPELLSTAITGADGTYMADLLPLDRPLVVVSMPLLATQPALPQSSPAITLSASSPTATWSATFSAASGSATLSGSVVPAPDANQSDLAELLASIGGTLRIVATQPVGIDQGATFTFPSLPPGTYYVQVRRQTQASDGTITSALSALTPPTTLQAGGSAQVDVTF